MEANKEEALHAVSLAKKALAVSPPNIAQAKKLTLRSLNICETSEAHNLLERIRILEEETQPTGGTNAHATGTEAFAGGEGVKKRHHTASKSATPGTSTPNSSSATAKGKSKEDEKREYTAEQMAIVKRIRKCKVTEYYEILSLKKDCEEADIKKAYRKLALQLHPDKNGAPGADEAFKMVSKAFQVLSDSSLRAAYDQHGGDPESRFGGADMGGNATARNPFRANGSFEGELSPEDLFNMFFGGGFQGAGFGNGVRFGGSPFGGPTFTVNLGPNGFTTNRPRQFYRGGPARQNQPWSFKFALLQLLPILLFLVITFSSSIFDLLSTILSTPDPSYSFSPSARYSLGRTTAGNLKVPYWVNPSEFMSHSMMEEARAKDGDEGAKSDQSKNTFKQPISPALKRFESSVEERWQNWKYNECVRGRERIERKVEGLRGFMGIGTDWDAIKKARAEKVEACEDLKSRGFRII